MKKHESLEEFSRKADEKGMSYGKYEQYLYREKCLKKHERKRRHCEQKKGRT